MGRMKLISNDIWWRHTFQCNLALTLFFFTSWPQIILLYQRLHVVKCFVFTQKFQRHLSLNFVKSWHNQIKNYFSILLKLTIDFLQPWQVSCPERWAPPEDIFHSLRWPFQLQKSNMSLFLKSQNFKFFPTVFIDFNITSESSKYFIISSIISLVSSFFSSSIPSTSYWKNTFFSCHVEYLKIVCLSYTCTIYCLLIIFVLLSLVAETKLIISLSFDDKTK